MPQIMRAEIVRMDWARTAFAHRKGWIFMLPLSFAQNGETVMVAKIGGSDEVKKHLEDLGFVVGARGSIISQSGNGNVIVNLKESRLAITDQMAAKVSVVPSEPDIK